MAPVHHQTRMSGQEIKGTLGWASVGVWALVPRGGHLDTALLVLLRQQELRAEVEVVRVARVVLLEEPHTGLIPAEKVRHRTVSSGEAPGGVTPKGPTFGGASTRLRAARGKRPSLSAT